MSRNSLKKDKTHFRYFNREMSWLAFNRRVLDQAISSDFPLLERVRFLAFVSSNLDEFFEIRVAGLLQKVKSEFVELELDELKTKELLKRILNNCKRLVADQYDCWLRKIVPALDKSNILFCQFDELTRNEKRWLKEYFQREIFPALTPLAIDPAHPFPRLTNKALYILASIGDPKTRAIKPYMAIIPIPRILPRVIKINTHRRGKPEVYIFLSDIVQHFIKDLFPGYRVTSAVPFRITRNSDLYIDEEEVKNLLSRVEEELMNMHKGDAVRLEIGKGVDLELLKELTKAVELQPSNVFIVEGPINLSRLMSAYDLIERPEIKFPYQIPLLPEGLEKPENIFDQIVSKDILLHHPYESFQPFIDFLNQAASDPKVCTIKQTLYRTSGDSPIVKALMDASKKGKQVTVLVEIKARFDEANNIQWARQLEDVGVHVVYGLVGLKTHCKTCMVVRRENKGLRRYVHIGTGNYNPKTARSYTDFSLFTCREDTTSEIAKLFNTLTGFSLSPIFRKLLVAPFNLHNEIQKLILKETLNAKAGKSAHIIVQLNSLVDKETIDNLYRASQHGVKIDIIVRGICCLVPKMRGISKNIRVTSILGRYLEHSRIFYFENSNGKEPKIFAGSADWMPRNFYRRIETVFPIEDSDHRARMIKILRTYLEDNKFARVLRANGTYQRPALKNKDKLKSAQNDFLQAAEKKRIATEKNIEKEGKMEEVENKSRN